LFPKNQLEGTASYHPPSRELALQPPLQMMARTLIWKTPLATAFENQCEFHHAAPDSMDEHLHGRPF
jgi:hypothetical protein